jgi:hypothetical protein
LTSALDGGKWSVSRSCPINLPEKEVARESLNAVEKINISYHCWVSNTGQPTISPSLYLLSYPGKEINSDANL